MQRLLALGPLAALVFLTAACGAAPARPDEVASAGTATKAAGSARIETTTRLTYGDPVETHEFRWTELVDYENDRRLGFERETGCRTITIGEDYYSELAPEPGLPEGKHWVSGGSESVDAEAHYEQSRQQETTTSSDGITTWHVIIGVETPDPAPHDYLDFLREHSGEPERLGDEDVHGVPTTRYRAELDRARLVRAELESAGWKAANIDSYLEDIVDAHEQIEVWIDADGLVRRIVTTETPLDWEEGSVGGWVTTTEYFDFGLRVDVQAPPAAEVLDSNEWLRITEKRMREEMGQHRDDFESGNAPLPGAFEPSTPPAASSCLH